MQPFILQVCIRVFKIVLFNNKDQRLINFFYRDCIISTIVNSDSVEIGCPAMDSGNPCQFFLLDQEIRYASFNPQIKTIFCLLNKIIE